MGGKVGIPGNYKKGMITSYFFKILKVMFKYYLTSYCFCMEVSQMNKKGQTGIVVLVIGLVIGIVLLVGVLIPITTSTVDAQNFTGTNATIADNLTTFILIGVLVLVAGIALYGMARK
jgi:hypothetical protein